MPESYEPLVAYLEALRGSARKNPGSLDAARVSAFGLPGVWPGDDAERDLEERAPLVVSGIDDAIAVIGHDDPVYAAILKHYFFGTGDEHERQWAAALEAGRKPSTPRNYRRQAMLRLAERLYAAAEERGATLRRAPSAKPNTGALIDELVRVLATAYEPAAALDQLARIVASEAPPTYDASVTLTLRDDPLAQTSYILTLSTVSACRLDAYYLAVSPRSTLSDVIMATCGTVAAVFTCSRPEHVTDRAELWTQDVSALTILSSDARGRTKQKSLPLRLVDGAERGLVLADLPSELHDAVGLLRADIPRAPGDPPTRLQLQLSSRMDRSDHYCFWLADRPTLLKTITFDASGMTLGDDESFTLQPCLRATAYEPIPRDNVYEIRVDGWVVRGQGAMLVWGRT